jgi:hypothetical protein
MTFVRHMSALALVVLAPLAARAEDPKATWEAFRKLHPYHLQVVGLSRPADGGSRTLIVSEPAPHATREGIAACLGVPPTSVRVEQLRVGHDGWVRDVVATLPAMQEHRVAEVIDELHDYLFGTTYKAEALELPLKPLPGGANKLDIDVSALELQAWSLDPKETFRPVEGGAARPLKEILSSRRPGVFLSQAKKGLVAWSMPRGVRLDGHRARARQFAVDSDLILGAVATKDQMAILGRERSTPFRLLPPLRVETLEMLASAGTDHLAQSYERSRVFAGRFDPKRDWAPIYLSPELLNTEYGSLLNITDQLLKSWSSSGLIRYEAFDYPDPATWPFPKPAIRHLNTSELTFNWNTAGAGYAIEMGDLEGIALKRTGALPVSYIPVGVASTAGHEKTAAAETTAYDYFAHLGDPNLVRVVQYAGAYQIFRKFGDGAERPAPPTAAQTKAIEFLGWMAYETMDALRLADAARQLEITDRLAGPDPPLLAKSGISNQIRQLKGMIGEVHEAWGDTGLHELAARLADPRATLANDIERIKAVQTRLAAGGKIEISPTNTPEERTYLLLAISQGFARRGAQRILAGFADVKAVKESYSASFQGQDQGWIRTPSIVVSQPTGDLSNLVGGHNLDAKVSEFRAGKVEPGKVNLVRNKDGKLFVEYNEADRAKIPEIVRRVGKEADNPKLQSLIEGHLKAAEARPIREPDVALYPEPRVATGGTGRGYSRTAAAVESSGWEPSGATGPKRSTFHVRRLDRGFEMTTSDGEVFLAQSHRSLVDFMTTRKVDMGAGEKFHMEFVGLSREEVANTIRSCETRVARMEQLRRSAHARERVTAGDEVAEGSGGGRKPPPNGGEPPVFGEANDDFGVHFNPTGRTTAEFKAMIADYDLTKMEVSKGESRQVAPGRYEHSIKVVAPAIMAGPAPFHVRVRVYAKSVIQGWEARVTNFFRKGMGRFSEGPDAVLDLARELKAELHANEVDLDVVRGDEVIDSWYADATESGASAPGGGVIVATGGEADDRHRRAAKRAG